MKTNTKNKLINQLTGSFSARLFAAALLGLAAQTASAQNGTWTNKANGNWSTAINWAGGTIASGQDNTADFASVIWTNGHQTTLDAPYTVGTLKFGSVGNVGNTNYLLGANTLTLQTSTGNPTINASNQIAILGAPLASSQQVSITGNIVAITNAANTTSQTGGWILQLGQSGFMGQGALGGGPVTIGNAVGSSQVGFNMIDTAAAGTAPVVLANNFTIQSTRWIISQSGCTYNAQPVTILGNVVFNSGGANHDIAIQTGTTLTLGGVVSGGTTYGINFGALAGTLNLTNDGNTFGPAIILNAPGIIGATSDGALGFFNNQIRFTAAGGTFRALSSFTMGASRSMVFTAAGIIDTTNNTLQVDGPITGAGAITKNGTGTLNLTAANTFTGGVALNAGTFEVSGSGSLATAAGLTVLTNTTLLFQDYASVPNVASYTVNNGGKFVLGGSPTIKSTASITVNAGGLVDVSGLSSLPWTINSGQSLSGSGVVTGAVTCASGAILVPGTSTTAGTLTFNNNLSLNGQTIQFDLSTNTVEGGGTNDEIVVGGNLNLAGGEKIVLNYVNGALSAGTYKIIKFGGTLVGTFALASPYQNVTIDNGVGTPGYVTLVVSAPSIANNLFWKGDGSGNVWDVNTTANWVTNFANAALAYTDPSKVTFDNNGSNNVAINLSATVLPNSVTFSNTKPYTISGVGKITGPVGVTIAGVATNMFLTENDYAGDTTFTAGGAIQLGNGGATGAVGLGTVVLGATSGKVIVNRNSPITIPISSTGGNPFVIQNGTGTTTLTGSADDAGLTAIVNNGVLQLAKSSTAAIHSVSNATVNVGGTLQLSGTGGDQIFNGSVVTGAGGTFDANGKSETFKALNGYGSVLDSVGGATLTLTNAPGLNVSGGTMNANVSMTFGAAVVGFQVQSGATLNWLGGTLTYGSSTAGTVQGGGVFNMSGGALNSSTYFSLGSGTGTAIANFTGGTFTQPGEFLQCYGGGSFVTVSSNAVMNLHYWSYGDRFGSTNYFNGGLTKMDAFGQRGNTAAWAGYFNGGTIQAKSTVAHFLPNALLVAPNQHAYISTNGLIFDNQTFSVTIDQNLEHDPSLGASLDGGLTKLGSGTLTLNGTNSFNGSLTNSAGTLVFKNNGSYNHMVIGDNATNQVNVFAAGTSLTNSALTIGSTGAGTQGLNFNLGTFGAPTAPLITVNGNVTNSGNVLITLIAPVLSPGTIPLLQYGSMDAVNFASTWTVNPYPYVSLTLTNDTVQKLVSIIVVPGVTPKWKGDLSSAWDTTTLNWRSNGIAAYYTEPTAPGTPVTFDDTAVNFTVDISAATVNPLFINMTNGSHDYTITGSTGIGGTGALIKNGTGALIFNNTAGANTYSGITTVNGGSVVVAAANLLSPNSAMTFNTSTLILSNNNQTVGSGGSLSLNNSALVGNCILTGSGGLLNLNNTTNFTLEPVLAGSLGVNQNGIGEMTITNNNSYTGATTINSGSIRVRNGNGLGAGGFNSSNTQIQSGGSLILDGSFTIAESLIMNGTGFNGVGCLVVTNGNVVANGSPCQVLTATIYVSAGSSIDFQGAAGGNSTVLYSGGLTKSGPGDLLVGGLPANACTANPIVVAQGRFISTNCNTTSFITVNSGATLAGNGPFNGAIDVLVGGNLTPNLYGTTTTMTSAAGLTNAGAMTLQLLKTATTTNADQINATAAFVNTGTLTVITNVGTTLPLAAGDSFKLFNLTNYTALTGLTPTLPALPTGLGWTNKLTVNGTIAVVATVSTTPFALGTSVSGNQLTLTWPADHTGWRLQVQTNSLSTGLSGTWNDVPGATTVDNVIITIDPTQGTAFYRMVYP